MVMMMSLQRLRDHVWSDGVPNPQVADFLCPLTSNVMVDPVKAEDGHTYERKEIEKWLETRPVSPQTRKPMGKELAPDTKLKKAIEKYEKAHIPGRDEGEESRNPEDGSTRTVEISWPTGGHKTPDMEETRCLVIQPAALSSELEPKPKRARVDPEILQDGAGSSSMAEALSKFFRELDPLRELLREVLEGWAPPRIVVIGDESAGKSTILEQLANMPIFPRNRRFCTRLPIHLRLRRDPDASKAQLSVYKTQEDGSEVKEGDTKDIPQESGWRDVQKDMESLVAQFGSDGLVRDMHIVVEIRHPHVPSIDLVDLPGLAGHGGKKAAINQILQRQLDFDERNGKHDMFLAVMPAAGVPRPSTNMAMNFVQEKKLQERTFGVFSKCDQTSEPEVLRALVLKEAMTPHLAPEELGQVSLKSWVACMLKPPTKNFDRLEIHSYERLFQQTQNEQTFFKQHEDDNMKSLAREKAAGIACLVQKLEEGYSDYLHKSWKKPAMTKILQKLEQKEAEFKDLGVVDEHAQGLAEKEVKKRLHADNEDVKNLYASFKTQHLSAFRSKIETYLKDLTRQPHEVCKLKESVRKMETQMKDACNEIAGSVVSHFIGPLQQLLEKEIPRMVRVRGKCNPMALWKKNSEIIMKNNDFIQLSRYPTFTKTIVEKCRELFEDAIKKMQSDSHAFIASLTDMNLPWLARKANEQGTAVSITCDMDKFLDQMEVVFLLCLPSPGALSQVVYDVQIGPSSAESKQKADDLKEELQKICCARDGLCKALFSDEELKNLHLSAPTAPDEPMVGERVVVQVGCRFFGSSSSLGFARWSQRPAAEVGMAVVCLPKIYSFSVSVARFPWMKWSSLTSASCYRLFGVLDVEGSHVGSSLRSGCRTRYEGACRRLSCQCTVRLSCPSQSNPEFERNESAVTWLYFVALGCDLSAVARTVQLGPSSTLPPELKDFAVQARSVSIFPQDHWTIDVLWTRSMR
eukprot:s107_g27.t1